ncbi:hypothetical protein Tco_0903558 [Tanacetum coccineum]
MNLAFETSMNYDESNSDYGRSPMRKTKEKKKKIKIKIKINVEDQDQDQDQDHNIWEALGGNTRDLDSIWEETDKITTLHEVVSRMRVQCLEMASQFLATPSELTSDDVKIYVMAS